MRYFQLLICVPFIIGLLSACGGGKKVVTNEIALPRTVDTLVQTLTSQHINYDWIVAKGKAKFANENESIGTKIYLRMKKDSIIWLVIKKYSVEQSRILIRPDSFFILYRLDQVFERGTFDQLNLGLSINYSFEQMQALLAGNYPIPDLGTAESYIFSGKNRLDGYNDDLKLSYIFHPSTLAIETVHAEDSESRKVMILLGDINEDSGIPFMRHFFITDAHGSVSKALVDFSEFEIDKPKTTKFSIPAHYEEL